MSRLESPESPASQSLHGLTCWVVTDGKAGMEIQCLGLAEAMGCVPVVKRVSVGKPWRWMPAALLRKPFKTPLETLGPKGDSLSPPWPDLWIASGRQTVPLTRDMKRLSGGKTFTVQVQNPAIDPAAFDLIVTPEHDRLRAENVLTTRGALGRITAERLAAAAEHFEPLYAQLPARRVAVLIGGNNKVFRMTADLMTKLTGQLARLVREEGVGLMVTPSRRTGARNEEILRRGLEGLPAHIWDGNGENPYFGMLGLADAIVCTGDSVNMVSESASTGKPVHIVQLEGGSAKFRRFHQAMQAAGITRPFTGALEQWSYTPLDETHRVADEIRRRLRARLAATG
ncbi:mitochondrial fission ELM1 family protein [Pelagibius marinus]|uniref:mitochondrial fission ELM1 family protein n=1 Tax=Pelagibius marinus TaxID=2762760 RepID=UPI001D03993E|nr:mitochondrial fission ELM1 family protein [Pelagibius marinus]